MLIGNKKTQENDQNWSVVLNPLRNEMDKKRVSRKISEVFMLSPEEASDLVSNTPIILLDNLTQSIAAKVKEFFDDTGAELILTNDVFLKRKCYRTVWPEPPNLSFLLDWDTPEQAEPVDDERALSADEALNEIRSMDKQGVAEDIVEKAGEIAKAHDALERELQAHRPAEQAAPEGANGSAPDEIEKWRRECMLLREDKENLRQTVDDLEKQLSEAESAKASANGAMGAEDQRVKEITSELANIQEKHELLKDEYKEARNLFERKLTETKEETVHWKHKADEMAAKLQEFVKTKEKDKKIISEGIQEANHLRERCEALSDSQYLMQAALDKEKSLRKDLEEQRQELTEANDKLATRIGVSEAKEKQLESKLLQVQTQLDLNTQKVEKIADEYRNFRSEHDKIVQSQQGILRTKDVEIERLKRQIREINKSIEQKESMQRKAKLDQQMAEKEKRLKELVQFQDRIEEDMHEQQESLKKVLAEQEALEKGIIEIKQAHRHFVEQAKKEQRSSRVKIARAEDAPAVEETPNPSAQDND